MRPEVNSLVTIHPVLLNNHPDRLGRFPISIVVYDRASRKRHYKTTAFRILPKFWDSENCYVKRTEPNHSAINTKVLAYIEELEEEIARRIMKQQPVSIPAILHGAKASDNMLDYFEELIEQLRQLRNKFAPVTIQIYENELRRLKEYTPALFFSDVDNTWLRKYESFLTHEAVKVKLHDGTTIRKGLSNNSIHKSFKVLKKVFNMAIRDGITKEYPFSKYDNPKYKQTDRTHLTLEEVNAIEEVLKLPLTEGQLTAGYYFLLGCYSGLRYSDWQRFNPKFIQGDRLIVRAKKNGELVSMQMHHRLKQVVEKILTLPGVASEPKTNEFLKGLAVMAKLKKKVTTHVARHSFAVRCAELGIPIETTAELMGITIKTCAIYYQITNRKIDAEFGKWNTLPDA